jgi:hypothetical protein
MANPNIVNVTQIYGQTTYLTPANTSNFVLVTNAANSGNVFKLDQIVAANQTNTAANVTVSIYTSGGVVAGNAVVTASSNTFPIASNISVPAYASLIVMDKTTATYLTEDRAIVVASGTNSAITFSVSYEQISS